VCSAQYAFEVAQEKERVCRRKGRATFAIIDLDGLTGERLDFTAMETRWK
jgi:hypothetical protein